MSIRNTTEFNHYLCEPYAGKNFTAIDATCGNGFDTLWLFERFGKVYAFDIQKEAVENTERVIKERGDFLKEKNIEAAQVKCILDSHENMEEYLKSEELPVNLVMFNLGYLPGGDKEITTDFNHTIIAIKASLDLLAVGGLVSIMIYWGHESGKRERAYVMDFAKELDRKKYHVIRTDMMNQPGCPPEILLIEKKK